MVVNIERQQTARLVLVFRRTGISLAASGHAVIVTVIVADTNKVEHGEMWLTRNLARAASAHLLIKNA